MNLAKFPPAVYDSVFTHVIVKGGANGTVGASYSFAESYDGGSSLRLTGVLNEKATATFPLYRCACGGGAFRACVRVLFSEYGPLEFFITPAALFGRMR